MTPEVKPPNHRFVIAAVSPGVADSVYLLLGQTRARERNEGRGRACEFRDPRTDSAKDQKISENIGKFIDIKQTMLSVKKWP